MKYKLSEKTEILDKTYSFDLNGDRVINQSEELDMMLSLILFKKGILRKDFLNNKDSYMKLMSQDNDHFKIRIYYRDEIIGHISKTETTKLDSSSNNIEMCIEVEVKYEVIQSNGKIKTYYMK